MNTEQKHKLLFPDYTEWAARKPRPRKPTDYLVKLNDKILHVTVKPHGGGHRVIMGDKFVKLSDVSYKADWMLPNTSNS